MEGQDPNMLTIEAGAPADLIQRVKDFGQTLKQDTEGQSNVQFVKNPDAPGLEIPQIAPVKKEENATAPETKTEAKAPEAKAPTKTEEKPTGDQSGETNLDTKLKISFEGKERELSASDVQAAMGRAKSFQKRNDDLMKGEELKLGTLMVAAQGGDVKAQKKLQGMLLKMTKAEDGRDLDEKLEEVEDDFDADKIIKSKTDEAKDKAEWDESFGDVENNVDYKQNLDIVETDLRGQMPAKVFNTFWARPDTRRAMYNLVSTGRMEELLGAFAEKVSTLPFSDKIKIETDPDFYGAAFTAVVKEQNALQVNASKAEGAPPNNGNGSPPAKSAISSVSPGTQGKTPAKADEGLPDFEKMTFEELDKWKLAHGLRLSN